MTGRGITESHRLLMIKVLKKNYELYTFQNFATCLYTERETIFCVFGVVNMYRANALDRLAYTKPEEC